MTEEKLNELREKVSAMRKNLRELSREELAQVFGGTGESDDCSDRVVNYSSGNITFYNITFADPTIVPLGNVTESNHLY